MDSLCSSWLPTQTLILQISLIFGLASPSPDSQAVKYPSSSCTLKRTVGTSVQLTLTSPLDPNIREIEWNWQPEGDEKTQLLVSWKPQIPNPDWYDLEEIYKHRLNLTEMAFLSIRNLTMEMSGLYTAKIKFNSGKSNEEAFRLCLYGSLQSKWHWLGILLMALMASLGAGVWIWMRKKMQTRRGESTLLPEAPGVKATPQALPTEESANLQTGVTNSLDSAYEEISFLRHLKKDSEKGNCHSHNPECTSAVQTIYEKIRRSPKPQGDA